MGTRSVETGDALLDRIGTLEKRVARAVELLDALVAENLELKTRAARLGAERDQLRSADRKLGSALTEVASLKRRVEELTRVREEARSRARVIVRKLEVLDADMGLARRVAGKGSDGA